MNTEPKFALHSKVRFRGEYGTFFVIERFYDYDRKVFTYALRAAGSATGIMADEALLEQREEKKAD